MDDPTALTAFAERDLHRLVERVLRLRAGAPALAPWDALADDVLGTEPLPHLPTLAEPCFRFASAPREAASVSAPPLGGLRPAEAAARLARALTGPASGPSAGAAVARRGPLSLWDRRATLRAFLARRAVATKGPAQLTPHDLRFRALDFPTPGAPVLVVVRDVSASMAPHGALVRATLAHLFDALGALRPSVLLLLHRETVEGTDAQGLLAAREGGGTRFAPALAAVAAALPTLPGGRRLAVHLTDGRAEDPADLAAAVAALRRLLPSLTLLAVVGPAGPSPLGERLPASPRLLRLALAAAPAGAVP